jgi:hypothetical protein
MTWLLVLLAMISLLALAALEKRKKEQGASQVPMVGFQPIPALTWTTFAPGGDPTRLQAWRRPSNTWQVMDESLIRMGHGDNSPGGTTSP